MSNSSKLNTELITLVRTPLPDLIKKLIKDGANVNYVDLESMSPLCYAVESLLSSSTKEGSLPGKFGEFSRVESHDLESIKALISNGANVNVNTRIKTASARFSISANEFIPLFIYVVMNKQIEIAKLFLATSCDYSVTDKLHRNILHIALCNQDIPMVKLLLIHCPKLDINSHIPTHGYSVFYSCVLLGSEIVQLLLHRGADPNIRNKSEKGDLWTPLMGAIFHEKLDVIELLLNFPGIDTKLTTKSGVTNIELAERYYRYDAFKLLKSHHTYEHDGISTL